MTSSQSPVSVSISSTASPQTVVIKGRRYRQRPLGPAPFASFEDLSDELDSPPEAARVPLPGIKEDPASQIQTPNTPQIPQAMNVNLTEKEGQALKEALAVSLDTPAPPRIDISRASSSSQHEDSITSSPEKEGANLGYKEDGTLDLRSSTEELDYIQEPGTVEESEAKRKREKMMKKQQQLKHDFCDTQSEHDVKERKDSNCSVVSDIGLLCISGRTSRLSSIGSAASGGSAASAASHLSGASHLSIGSHLSGRSTRSPSPHKMLLETSFCGSKPMHTQSIDVESAPSLVSHVEKPASRPPSRLRSRSPSPHKMLLETSFCGTKHIAPVDPAVLKKKKVESAEPSSKHGRRLSPAAVDTTVEITPEKVPETEKTVTAPVKKDVEKLVTENVPVKREKKPEDAEKPKKVIEAKELPVKRKPITIPKRPVVTKPKKVISLRDIPADEIYIPLKGPEVDFEEIIRQTSPRPKRKPEKENESADEIYISLHSPPKSSEKTEVKKREVKTVRQESDDGIYIPLHSPPKSPKPPEKEKIIRTAVDVPAKISSSSVSENYKKSYEPKKTKYEVCEDGSIIIPLHSPEEERNARTFEEEIRRVDQELQKARQAAERRQREEDKQVKPVTLDLSDSGSSRSRLSQSFPSGKADIPSGGSRTPSPGSSLSRKSSFASLFRKSDISGSPDSPAGSIARKKSGNLSNILKEASDGLRERSRSRSKSRERQPHASAARSPSIKKNVFTNFFTKRKSDTRSVPGKAEDETPPRLDLKFTFNSETESNRNSDQGDYIIIPLRDPSDPPASLEIDNEFQDQQEPAERSSSPIVILERTDSPKSIRRSREIEESVEIMNRCESKRSISLKSGAEDVRSITEDRYSVEGRGLEIQENAKVSTADGSPISKEEEGERESITTMSRESSKPTIREMTPSPKLDGRETSESKEAVSKEEADSTKFVESALQHESSVELEEDRTREELVAVSSGGVRKLKLPPEPGDLEEDHERKGLVLQESFEDELPYVPTTLPLERSVGVPIVPIKNRVAEIKTCSIERPRSTTPINPSSLEDYVSTKEAVRVSAEEKMKISLPREDSISGRAKSPRRFSAKGKTWFEFAEAGLQSPRDYRKSSLTTTPSPPPLPPRATTPSIVGLSTSAPQATTSWINFEELPEKRKLPKRITTVPPLRSTVDGGSLPEKSGASVAGNVVYSYVSPEDCQCECHDHNTSSHLKERDSKRDAGTKPVSKKEHDMNGKIVIECHQTKHKLIQPQGDNEKLVTNECEDCESGRHIEGEEDALEERPLLENTSDGENDDSSSKRDRDWDLTIPGSRLEVDRQSHLSDSSYEATSTGGRDNSMSEAAGVKPFAMDLDVHSNRSSVVSQDEQPSPDEISNSLPR